MENSQLFLGVAKIYGETKTARLMESVISLGDDFSDAMINVQNALTWLQELSENGGDYTPPSELGFRGNGAEIAKSILRVKGTSRGDHVKALKTVGKGVCDTVAS